jgi:hypothetical protein
MLRNPLILFFVLILVSCVEEVIEYDRTPLSTRTVLVYMAADNDLHDYALQDIAEMQRAILPENVHLLVYLDIAVESIPQILEILNGEHEAIKQYKPEKLAFTSVLCLCPSLDASGFQT